ncbi:MAG: cyclic nucleotide-binding domain-containing protein [Thermoanaerobaculia bacterium]|nr:cyclic nucleotide-binding domain-containing protein [Thermoanaerobaculia bacterium]
MSSRQRFDLIIVGSGPAGIATASHAHDNGINYVLLEKTDHLSDTIFCYQARKYVMAEPMAIPARGDVPFEAGSREQILGAWESHAKNKQLKVEYNKEVKSVKKVGATFEVKAADGSEYEGKWVVLAMGTQGSQRKPGCPGEDMSHVLYRLADPSEYAEKDIIVVGAGDSAIEIAVALADENRVSLVVRSAEIVRAKDSLIREVLTRQAQGSMTVYYGTTLKEITLGHTDLNVRGETVRVRSDYIFLKLGADAPRKFFESIGVKYTSSDKDARPSLTPQYESVDVPGLFLIGAASGRDLVKLGMNQGWEVVEHLCGRKVDPADEAVLKERLPHWSGSVVERMQQIKQRVPLLAAADDENLREMFLSTNVREYRDGEAIIRQNDYTNEFLIIAEGRVQLWVSPEGSKEQRKITTMTAGNFFGEMSLISGRRRTATAIAEGPTRIIEVPRKAILKLLVTSPRVKDLVDQAFLIRAIQGYLFGDTPATVLGELAAKATMITLAKDAPVFKEGDPGDAFYLIRNGMVKIGKTSNDKEIVLSYLVAGNFFGESALLEGAPRTATVTTIFPSELIKLSKRDFDQFLDSQPELRKKLLKKLEDRRVLSLIAEATPGSGSILNDLIREEVVMGTHSLIIDNHKCVRCSNCIRACEGVHADGQSRLSLTGIQLYNLLAPNSCWQCQNPMCMLDCPPDALTRDPRGEVYIRSNCIGCGNCERNCPYGNIFMVHPKHEGGGLFGWIKGLFSKEKAAHDEVERTLAVKCDLCREISGGPACVRSCPTGAAVRLTPEEYRGTLEELVIMRGER